jgi:hypothetical protein
MAEQTAPKEDYLIFEYVEDAGNLNGFVLKPIAASEAFRRYSFLTGKPGLNKSGNLRGMVINKQAHTVFKFADKAGDRLAVLGVLIEVSKEWTRMKQVGTSNMSLSERTSRILLLGSAAILRSVTSIVPTVVELGALSASGYGELYSLLTGSPDGTKFGEAAKAFASDIKTIHSRQWDGQNWYDVIEAGSDSLFSP